MTDTTDLTAAADPSDGQAARTRGGLAAMNVVDLKNLASQLGIRGTARMRKDDLVSSIVAQQAGSPTKGAGGGPAPRGATPETPQETAGETRPEPRDDTGSDQPQAPAAGSGAAVRGGRRAHSGVTTPAPVTEPAVGDDGQASSGVDAPGAADRPSTAEVSAPPSTSSTSSVDENRRRAELQDELARTEHGARERHDAGQDRREPRQDRQAGTERQERQDRRDRQAESQQSPQQRPQQGRLDLPDAGQAIAAGSAPSTGDGGSDVSEAQAARQAARQSRREAQAARQAAQAARQEAAGGASRGGGQGGDASPRQGAQGGQGSIPSGGSTSTLSSPQGSSQGAPAGAGAMQGDYEDDDRPGGRRRNRQRSRDRKRRGVSTGASDFEPELQVADDDVLVPVAGILDVLDNYAFVRTSGYLPGPSDVYVPLGLVKKHALRKGDAVTGAVKALREGEQPQQGGSTGRQKFNALVRLDSINGAGPDETATRSDFAALTPLYPQERLRLETETSRHTARVIDLFAPIGKGQRGLVIAPAKAGATSVLQAVASAVTANNPECHLMVVLVDERPEEVTEMQRTVKGEVIASTFDRPAEDHTTVAELAIERAKRLVELGHDVVVLLDSLTALGRAYNLASPASGRILSGGVDSAALYPPKRFFGAARNIENGGSLTIIATALVETGSRMDEVIFEDFRGTATMELTLSRELADQGTYPAVVVSASGTRRDELLMSEEELSIVHKLRRALSGVDAQRAMDVVQSRLKKSRSNIDLLRQVQATPAAKLTDA